MSYFISAPFEGPVYVKSWCNPGARFPQGGLPHTRPAPAVLPKGRLLCWSVFNESDHAQPIWPLAQQEPVITTSCFPPFSCSSLLNKQSVGRKACVSAIFSLRCFISLCKAALCTKYWSRGLKITNRQLCKRDNKQPEKKKCIKAPNKYVPWSNC